MKRLNNCAKDDSSSLQHRFLMSEDGVGMILVCLSFLAILGVIAISLDGFSLVHSKLTLHNSAEYAAEAGLRYFNKQLAACNTMAPECDCDIACTDIEGEACFACIKQKACERAGVVAKFRLFAGGLTENIDLGCESENPGLHGWFQLGDLHEDDGQLTFEPATNKDGVVTARAFLVGTQDKIFFAKIWGYSFFNLRTCAVSSYDPTPNTWL